MKEENTLSPEELLLNEPELLKGLLEATGGRQAEENWVRIDIARKGRLLFSFRIRPLGEEEYTKCRDDATKYVRNKQLGGIKLPEDTNTVRYRSALIYTATIEEDRKKLWDNKEAQRQINVLNGVDVVEKALFCGEKDAVISKIDSISGYDSSMEEVAKNS